MGTLWQDLRYALRVFRSSPTLTAVAVGTLALGIAVNTTVFSWTEGLLLHPFPGVADGGRLVVLEMVTAGAPNGANNTSYLDFRDYRDNLASLDGLTVRRQEAFGLGDTGSTQTVWGELVSGNFFQMLGVKAALGRTFTPEEAGDKPGAYPVAVISDRLWRLRYHADPRIIGKTLRANHRELTIIGITSPEFRGTVAALVYDIWVPITMGPELGMLEARSLTERGYRNLQALGRLKPGVSVEQANAEAARYSANLAATYPETNRRQRATILPPWRSNTGAPELLLKPLQILMAAALVVLLIVCANVANLLLARSLSRRRELSIRMALGAGRGRLIRQLLTETLVLAGAGTVLALPLAFWLEDMLPALLPKIDITAASGVYLNGRILAFTICACVLTALISGAAPAFFWARSDVNEALKEGGRTGHAGKHSQRLRSLLVMAEVAMATVALIGAGLFVRSFHNARTVNLGFDMHNVVLVRFYMGGTVYSTNQAQQFCRRLRDRLQSAPGVSDVSYADYTMLGSSAGPYGNVDVEGYVPGTNESMQINNTLVAPGYFSLLRIPLIEGRDFKEADTADAEPVIVVNQAFARRYFGGANPVGRKVRCGGKWTTVVGLARDTKYFNVAEPPHPFFFAAFTQWWSPSQQLFFFVRTTGDPMPVMAAMHREVAAVDANAGAFQAMPLKEWTDVTLLPQKLAASMLGALGLIALLLAGVGLYSVMAYAIVQRTPEIGIRMALGARARHVLRDVLAKGLVMIAGGLGAGLALAAVMVALLREASSGMLVNVSAADPLTFAGAVGFLVTVGLAACYLPALRATRINPISALRCE